MLLAMSANPKLAGAQAGAESKALRPPATLPLTGFYDTPHPLPPGKPGELIRSEPAEGYHLPYELSVFRILYRSRTAKGKEVPVSGVVLIPPGKPPAGGWPIIGWAHEFRGAARQCAPSLMRNLDVGPVLAMYANLGYAVVATDYSGLGASGSAVLDMESNALDVIYSIPAARAALAQAGTKIGPKWIAVGAFQGAMAALGVGESEVRDPNYLGSVALSGLGAGEQTYQHFGQGTANRVLLASAFTIKALYPDFQVTDMLKQEALPAYQRVTQTCGVEAAPEFTTEKLKPGWEINQFVKEFVSRNTPGQKPTHEPLLVISGLADSTIPAKTAERSVAHMCKQGDRVLFLKYPDLDASGALGGSVSDQISWIKARFAGDAAPSNCP